MKDKIALSVSEMALQLGISIPKAYELTKEPGFPILKIGTRILIPIVARLSRPKSMNF